MSFCDLASNPEQYNQKVVRTDPIAAVMTFEVAFLYDPKCNTKDAWIDYEFEMIRHSRSLIPFSVEISERIQSEEPTSHW